MRLRKLALAVGLAGTFGSGLASALGLGDIRLLSHLNEPLQAEIKLLQVRDLSESEILVDLASKTEFQRVGIDRPYFLSDLQFEIDLDAPSGPLVRVTSRNPVREPYLNFLLESQWPNGRILREYTLLMDLPVFSDDRVQPLARAASRDSAASPDGAARSAPPAAAESAPPPRTTQARAAAPADSAAEGVYGPVSTTDTLWGIALKVRPDRSYSVHKTMLAIQRLNPEAFINGNINLLRRGQVLRIPSASQIDVVSQRQAVSEVALQNNQWDGADTTSGAPLDATGRTEQPPVRQGAVEGRLKVAGDELGRGASEARASGAAVEAESEGTEALQSELAVSLEELDKVRRENADLQDRVRKLEEQIKTMERLVEVSSQEMRALQLQGSGARDDEAAAAAQAPAAAGETRRGGDWMTFVTDNILYLGGGLVAILAAVLLLLRRRDGTDEADELPLTTEPEVALAAPVTAAAAAGAVAASEAGDDVELDDQLLSDEDELFGDSVAPAGPAATAAVAPAAADAAAPVQSQTDDVVGEADIYIAYGKLDLARDMLLNALASEPGNTAARLKLMEVYAESNDLASFDEQYAQIVAGGDETARVRADDLRLHFEDGTPLAAADDSGDDDFSSWLEQDESSGGAREASAEAQPVADTFEAPAAEVELDVALDEDGTHTGDEEFEFSLDLDEEELRDPDEVIALEDDRAGDDSPADDDFALDLDLGDEPQRSVAETEPDFDLDFDEPLADEAAESESLVALEDAGDDALKVDFDDSQFDLGGADDGLDLDFGLDDEPGADAAIAQTDSEAQPAEAGDAAGEELAADANAQTLTYELGDDFDLAGVDQETVDLEQLDRELGESGDLAAAADAEFNLSDLGGDIDTDAGVESSESEFDLSEDGDIDLAALDQELEALAEDSAVEVEAVPGEPLAGGGLDGDETLFSEALADLPSPEDVLEGGAEPQEEEGEFDFLAETDEIATKLDLARAYIDMGDHEGALDILDEVAQEGDEQQRQDAEALKARLG